jgi:hypothetical protein
LIVEDKTHERETAEIPAVPTIPATPVTRSRRNPKWVALGVIALCLGAIASFFLYSQVAESHQVIAVRKTVSRGTTITADDLGVVRVGDIGGARSVPASRLPELVGALAAHDLVEGSLLPPGAITRVLPPEPGHGVIGIRVASGRAPAGFLAPGSPVRLVVLPPNVGGEAGSVTSAGKSDVTNVATIPAVVVNSQAADDGQLINLELASEQAVDAASYAAQERLAVVRESER